MSDELEQTGDNLDSRGNELSPGSEISAIPTSARALAPRGGGTLGEASSKPRETPNAAGFANYLHAFRRRWFSALAVGFVGAVAAGISAWLLAKTTFTSTALIRVSAENQKLLFRVDENLTTFDLYKGTQMQLLTSDYVLTAALRNIPNFATLRQQDDPLRWLATSLRLATDSNSEIVRVSLAMPDGNEAAAIVQGVVDAYMTEVVDKERQDRERRLRELNEIYTQKEIEMRSKRTELKKLAEQLGSGDMSALSLKQQLALQQFGETRAELNRIRNALGEDRAKLSAKQAAAKAQPSDDQLAEDIDDAESKDSDCGRLHQQIDAIDAELAELKAGLQPVAFKAESAGLLQTRDMLNHKLSVRRQKLSDQLAKAPKTIAVHDGGIQELESQIAYYSDREKKVEQELDAEEKQTEHYGNSSIDVEMLRAEIDELNKVLTAADDERQQLQVELNSQLRIQQLQKASIPAGPDPASRMRNTALFAILGFFAPIGLLLWWDLRAQRINTVHDVTDHLGLTVLGSVPHSPIQPSRGKRESSRHRRMQIGLDHSIDGIAAKLFLQRESGRGHIVLVSSATRGEGKSTLSLQLAKRLAQSGASTLLVDFDLRKPTLHLLVDEPRGPGLSEYLRSKGEVESLIRQTQTENLSLLTAGSPLTDSLGILSNGVTHSLFEHLRDGFDFVIVDGTPILPVVDALLIGQHVDSVILSVRRDVSQIHRVRAACERLSAFGVEEFAAVVTGTSNEPYDYTDIEPAPSPASEAKPKPK